MPKITCTKFKKTFLENLRLISLIVYILLGAFAISGFTHIVSMVNDQSLNSLVESDPNFSDFEADLDEIRQALKIPGMSAAIVQDQELVWAAGFGYADLENQLAAEPDTPYGLASVTKPVAAVLIMQLVAEGAIELDTPITHYGVDLGNEAITVRHLLTHTSEGIPGTEHHYNGNRYGFLGGIIEEATGQTFAALLSERILLPLEMKNSALNPINSWGGPPNNFFEDLKFGLSQGENYQHYPDVYERYAKPYQLDDGYNIVPGMYPLYHNPAAGLISSVTDLAKFDIALDQGLLLGNSTKGEMFTPAYSTFDNHSDLNYGLGWFIQDFEGLRLLWHSGRWPPSTSALYVKIPEKNLTFIILANTDNLTVPFVSIGYGDVSKSILFLSFFRHFIFPDQYGYDLQSIDWNADQDVLLQQLANVDDEVSREFLERELWSFRQVNASTGQVMQAEKLRLVSFRAFPNSKFSRDWMFTQISGPTPIVPQAVPAAAVIWLNRVAVLWFTLVSISVIWIAVRLACAREFSWWGKLLWLIATIFLGPIPLILVHRYSQPAIDGEHINLWQRAWGASMLGIAGHSVAWFIAIAFLMSSRSDPHPIMTLGLTYFLPLLVSFSLVRIPYISKQTNVGLWLFLRRSLLLEVIMMNLRYAIFFPLTMFLSLRLFSQTPYPTSLLFWSMISFIAIVSLIVSTPVEYWLLRRGDRISVGLVKDGARSYSLPAIRSTWPAFVTTLAIMAIALVITIGQLG